MQGLSARTEAQFIIHWPILIGREGSTMVSVSDDWMLYCALPPSNVVQSSYQACVAQMGDESQSKTIGLIPDRAGSGNPILPHFIKPGEAIPRITKETLAGVLRGSDSALLGQVHIIDCRFRYEYDGGHRTARY